MNKTIALIPARGGSKRIKKKNIRLLNGVPLIGNSIEQLKKSNIDEIWVSTDNKEISDIAIRFGAKVLNRPSELSRDTTKSEPVIEHFLENVDCDVLVFCEATHPMTTTKDINNCLIKFKLKNIDSLILLSEHHLFLLELINEVPEPINFEFANRQRSQDSEKVYMESGLWITKRDAFLKSHCRVSGKIGYHIVSHPVVDIDNETDFQIAEVLTKNQ